MASSRKHHSPIKSLISLSCIGIITMVGLVAFYQGVIKAPILDPDRPYTGNFNALFSPFDTHLAAARHLIEERRLYLAEPELGDPPAIDAALKHLNMALQHRPNSGRVWVMKAQQEMIVNRDSTADDKYDEALRALRISNRLAPHGISLTVPRLDLATRLWRHLSDNDKAEIERQVEAGWFDQGPKAKIIGYAVGNVLARRIIRRALADSPEKLAEYKYLLAGARKAA